METLEQRRNRLTRLRRERILNYIETLYVNRFQAYDDWINAKEGETKRFAYDIYDRLLVKTYMFEYGVAMADPNGKWHKRFNDLYEKAYKEFYKKKEDTEQCEESPDCKEGTYNEETTS